jgi:SHS2 domain-containing protein
MAEAFAAAARGMISVILDPSTVEAREERRIAITASDPEQLLVRWLSELLYLYDGAGFIGVEFNVSELTPLSLRATAWGESFSEDVQGARLDVKAVTYHQITVEETEGGARVRVYLDI